MPRLTGPPNGHALAVVRFDHADEQRIIHHVDRCQEESVVVQCSRQPLLCDLTCRINARVTSRRDNLGKSYLGKEERVAIVETKEVLIENGVVLVLAPSVAVGSFEIAHARHVAAEEKIFLYQCGAGKYALRRKRQEFSTHGGAASARCPVQQSGRWLVPQQDRRPRQWRGGRQGGGNRSIGKNGGH